MTYKLVMLDMDGTLLNDESIISDNNIFALNELNNRGVNIAISTGRRLKEVADILSVLDFEPYIVSVNGAMMTRGRSDFILSSPLSNVQCSNVVDVVKNFGGNPIFQLNPFNGEYGMAVAHGDYEANKDYFALSSAPLLRLNHVSEIVSEEVLGISVFGSVEELYELKNRLGAFDFVNTHVLTRVLCYDALLEIGASGVNKGTALKSMADVLKISRDEIIAFGDDSNDMPMLKAAGCGIAMKNASDEVKSSADAVCAFTNHEDGIYHTLKDIFRL